MNVILKSSAANNFSLDCNKLLISVVNCSSVSAGFEKSKHSKFADLFNSRDSKITLTCELPTGAILLRLQMLNMSENINNKTVLNSGPSNSPILKSTSYEEV